MSTKRKAPGKPAAPFVKASAQVPAVTRIDESSAAVSDVGGTHAARVETIEDSSESDSDEYLSDAEESAPAQSRKSSTTHPPKNQAKIKSVGQSPLPAQDANEEGGEEDSTSPSFGELLQGNQVIDVPGLLRQSSKTDEPLAEAPRATTGIQSHQSLVTVLTQALRTDDSVQLETCLHSTNVTLVRNTVERLDSALAGNLLMKLAAMMYRRPGRATDLMIWIRWTLIIHAGVLASQPTVLRKLEGLQKVLSERAKSLPSLLLLKGKLDMLESQMSLRQSRHMKSGVQLYDDDEGEKDEHLVWVEGDDEEDGKPVNGVRASRKVSALGDNDSDDAVPITNGLAGDSDDEETDSESVGDSDGAASDEALDEDEVDHDDMDDSEEEDESEVDAPPPTKMRKTT